MKGKFMVNLMARYVFLSNGTMTKYQLQSSRTNCQSIVHVGHLKG